MHIKRKAKRKMVEILTAFNRPAVVGGTTCSGVYTSSDSWRTYNMTLSLSGGGPVLPELLPNNLARFKGGENTFPSDVKLPSMMLSFFSASGGKWLWNLRAGVVGGLDAGCSRNGEPDFTCSTGPLSEPSTSWL